MATDSERVWLVERTYSDDEQNLVILTYATADGSNYHRKERALTSGTDVRETPVALEVEPNALGAVLEEAEREQYAAEAQRVRERHEPDDVL